jgi:hypothetical protein
MEAMMANENATAGLVVAVLCGAVWNGVLISSQPSFAQELSRPKCTVSNGTGICTYALEQQGEAYDYYRGDVRSGIPNGKGVFVYKNDNRYEGQVRNGQPNGQGMFLFANNDRYEGSFVDGVFSGSGKFIFTNGDRYTGQVRNGQPNGTGTLLFSGKAFTGQFYRGHVNGNGVLTTENGVRCQGTFYNSSFMGKATCTYPKGSSYKTYTGELRDGLPEGRGSVVYANGKQFSGEFRAGNPVVIGGTNK